MAITKYLAIHVLAKTKASSKKPCNTDTACLTIHVLSSRWGNKGVTWPQFETGFYSD